MLKRDNLLYDLSFCKELMDRLYVYARRNYRDDHPWGSNKTAIEADIIRLRRELNEIRHKLGGAE